jgi:hypothetical protein
MQNVCCIERHTAVHLSMVEYGYNGKLVMIRQEAVQPIASIHPGIHFERLRKSVKYLNPVMTCTGYLTMRYHFSYHYQSNQITKK